MEYTITTDDKLEAMRLIKSLHMALALWDISNVLHSMKHDDMTEKFYEGTLAFNKKVLDIMEDYNINLGELIN